MNSMLLRWAVIFAVSLRTATALSATLQFDFGSAETARGHQSIGADTLYTEERGYGWTPDSRVKVDDQGEPDALRRDFAWSEDPAVFRIDVPPGIYRLTITSGDMSVGNHSTLASVNVDGVDFPRIFPLPGQYVTATAAFAVEEGFVEIRFETERANWLVNAITLEGTGEFVPAGLQHDEVVRNLHWEGMEEWPDPIAPVFSRFRTSLRDLPDPEPTGLAREDYLDLIEGNVDFFKAYQDDNGAILDPYEDEEVQYSTPAYALAAITLVAHAGRDDLLESATRAMDWSVRALSRREGADEHEDFYAPLLAHALPLFRTHAEESKTVEWEKLLGALDPYEIYRAGPGGGNWNAVALSGEALLYQLGLREDLDFVEQSLFRQGRFFTPWGLYVDLHSEAMAYDHFARLWLADMMADGYDGSLAARLDPLLYCGALTSLFMQSPAGELPTGGRSAQHQWNEAQQCATFEIYAHRALEAGDPELAGVFKRAARRSLASLQRWVRPSGELWIVKNRFDPADRHGFEAYSHHSQYNLLAMGMLALAHQRAGATESGPAHDEWTERVTPAETGGFVLDLRQNFHKVIANAGGHYALVDTSGLPNFDATGLLRIHHLHGEPLLGPSDGISQRNDPRKFAATGVSWKDGNDGWHSLAEHDKRAITSAGLTVREETPERVSFEIAYEGDFRNAEQVVERYRLTPDTVRLAASVTGNEGPTRMVWPVFAGDGERETEIEVKESEIRVSLETRMQRFQAPEAKGVWIGHERFHTRNGRAYLGFAEFETGDEPSLTIRPSPADK